MPAMVNKTRTPLMESYQKKKREKGSGKAIRARAAEDYLRDAEEGTGLPVPGGQTLQLEATCPPYRGLGVDIHGEQLTPRPGVGKATSLTPAPPPHTAPARLRPHAG